jgi:hypothetical protein
MMIDKTKMANSNFENLLNICIEVVSMMKIEFLFLCIDCVFIKINEVHCDKSRVD